MRNNRPKVVPVRQYTRRKNGLVEHVRKHKRSLPR
jgi:hypothetical protein